MTDDTLSPVGFDSSRIVKTHLNGQERYAMACALGERAGSYRTPQAAFVREVLLAGLATLGWSEERMIREYADYRVRCIRDGEPNQFESE